MRGSTRGGVLRLLGRDNERVAAKVDELIFRVVRHGSKTRTRSPVRFDITVAECPGMVRDPDVAPQTARMETLPENVEVASPPTPPSRMSRTARGGRVSVLVEMVETVETLGKKTSGDAMSNPVEWLALPQLR
jgi:hypothetical protein